MELQRAAKQLAALGSETRLSIFKILIEMGSEGAPVGDIQRSLNIPASTLSHHISKLVQAGLVSQQRHSRTLICNADFNNIDTLVRFLMYNCCGGRNL